MVFRFLLVSSFAAPESCITGQSSKLDVKYNHIIIQQTACCMVSRFTWFSLNTESDSLGLNSCTRNLIPTRIINIQLWSGRWPCISVMLDTNTGDRELMTLYNQWISIAFLTQVHSQCVFSCHDLVMKADHVGVCACCFHTQVLLTWRSIVGCWVQHCKISAYVGMYMCNSRRNWDAVSEGLTGQGVCLGWISLAQCVELTVCSQQWRFSVSCV